MKIRYLDWREGVARFTDRLKLLKRLFSALLVREDGDVERALEFLRLIGEHHGLFDEELTFERLKGELLRERLVKESPGGLVLTPRGERFVRMQALDQVFTHLKRGSSPGDHRTPYEGRGAERLAETRPYQFGDEVHNIDYMRSYQNALGRTAGGELILTEDDLEVYETEVYTSVATVLMLDISHSMILYGEDRITPAKQVALALSELIMTQFPRDKLSVGVFGDNAKEIEVADLPYLTVGPYHTNTKAGLHHRIDGQQRRDQQLRGPQ